MRTSAGTGLASVVSPIDVALMSTLVLAISDSMIDSCQGIARSSMCEAVRPKCLTRPSARWRWRLNTMTRWKPSRMSPKTTARAPPPAPRTTACLRHLLAADELVERDLEAGDVGVVADRAACPRAVIVLTAPVDDASSVSRSTIGTTRSLCGIVTFAPEEVVGPQLGDRVGEIDRRPVPQLVPGVDAELVEGGLLHRAGQRVRHRMADEDDALRHARTPSRSAKKPG